MSVMEQFKNALRTFLLENKKGKMQGNQEWIMLKCPFCGDSTSENPHLNIRIPRHDNILYMICFQPECEIHRFPKATDILTLGFTDLKLLEQFSKDSLHVKVVKRNIHFSEGINYPMTIYPIVENYIDMRTGIPKSAYAHYRIIGNVFEFLDNNDYIDSKVKDIIKKRFPNNDIIGFLNDGKSKMQIRSLSKKEYLPYTLMSSKKYKFLDEHSDYTYTLNEFDLKENPVIVISEGNFDRLNSIKLVGENGKYISGLSAKGLIRVFKKYSRLYHRVRWIIISDKDVPISFYQKNIIEPYGYRITSMEVWYNTKAKDFGDLRDEMEVIKHTLV